MGRMISGLWTALLKLEDGTIVTLEPPTAYDAVAMHLWDIAALGLLIGGQRVIASYMVEYQAPPEKPEEPLVIG